MRKSLRNDSGNFYNLITGSDLISECGGPWGYENLLEVLKNPEDEGYASWKEWLPEDFDPERFDLDGINRRLSSRKWTTSPSRKRRKKTV
uniref:Plasmid pRiA4b Orf3-like domain-containing protein n=1 Tax=Leptospirillum ferriphilum TaxID=178606 RepID=A0A7C3LTE7_9BACT